MGLPPLKPDASLNHRLSHLLAELCTDAGFCLPESDAQRIANMNKLSADGFARHVLVAEGMDPNHEQEWMRFLAARFVEAFGSDAVTKAQFDTPPLGPGS